MSDFRHRHGSIAFRTFLPLAVVIALTISGCGGGDQTKNAATCLRNALANRALHVGGSCSDTTAARVEGRSAPGVICTHKQANEYICQVSGGDASLGLGIARGFYDVTYDGKSIVWQQAQ